MKLNRVLLINWLYYDMELQELSDIVFLSGKTGQGKSAYIDALQVVMLGDTSGYAFNKSASTKASRKLIDYLKGRYDMEHCRREKGNFSSHICCEFKKDNGDYFTCGVVFDCKAEENTQEHRFYVMNDRIPDHCYISEEWDMLEARTKKQVWDIRTLAEYVQDHMGKVCSSNMEYRDLMIAKLGIKDKRFFDIFKRAVSYSPVSNVSEFIAKYICDESQDIDIMGMQENIRDYQQMYTDMKTVLDKKEKLEKIHASEVKHKNAQEKNKSAILERQELEQHRILKTFEEATNQFQSAVKRQAENKSKKITLNEELEHVREALKTAYGKRNNNFIVQTKQKLADLDSKIKEFEERMQARMTDLRAQFHYIAGNLDRIEELEEQNVLAIELDLDALRSLNQKFLNQLDHYRNLDVEQLRGYAQQLHELDRSLQNLAIEYEQKKKRYASELQDLKDEIHKLESGKKNYEHKLLQLKQTIEVGLREKYHKDIPVAILADLFDVKDLGWKNAIETYLHNQRFHLLVDPEYYREASHIYQREKDRQGLYTYALVNVGKIHVSQRQQEGITLYDKIICEDPLADTYLKYLLQGIICCEHIDELEQYASAITKDCMLYKNYALTALNPKFYRVPFIGRDSIREQLEAKKTELHDLEEQYQEADCWQKALKDVRFDQLLSRELLNDVEGILENSKQNEERKEEAAKLLESISDEHELAYQKIEREINQLEKKEKNTQKDRDEILRAGGILDEAVRCANDVLVAANEQYEILQERVDLEKLEEMAFAQWTLTQINERIQEDSRIIEKTKNELLRLEGNLTLMKQEYNTLFHISLNTDMLSNDFQVEYESLPQERIDTYIDKAKKAEIDAKERFSNEFFNTLRNKIEIVQNQLDYLNKTIRHRKFGKSRYKFKWYINEDYQEYYNIIMNKDLDGGISLFNSQIYEDNKEIIDDLFTKVSSLSNITDPALYKKREADIKKYTNFTTYLKFDILENDKPLSKTIKGKSGGETQTPFYVAILASLLNVYDTTQGSLQLAVFDEAFDKMDTERIEESIRMLKDEGFQALIVTPTDKIPNLAFLADITYIAVTKEVESGRVSSIRGWWKDSHATD